MKESNVRRALLSVSDKTGITDFARALQRWNIEIISTGGTLKVLQSAGIPVRSVSDVTGFPEILDGRVKTLHPSVHAGLLAIRGNEAHEQQLRELEIAPIDMVVVNLYPFEETIAKAGITTEEAIEQIDIGGPAMLRSTAKNFASKTVIVDASDYERIIVEMERLNGAVSEETRRALARKVFHLTSRYDGAIAEFFDSIGEEQKVLPETLTLSVKKGFDLRYGENPHQQAAFYGDFSSVFECLHGKELSYNNIVDIQAADELAGEFEEPSVVIIKHTNPCGVGSGATLAEAYAKAFATDSTSAFGGIVCVNRPLDMQAAERINEIFTEVIIAPAFEASALALLKKKKDRRLIRKNDRAGGKRKLDIRSVAGGVLAQTANEILLNKEQLRVATERIPTEEERTALLFAWRVAKHVKSNAVVYAHSDRTIGIGAGQMSRVDSSRLAVAKAKEAGLPLEGTAVASDAFFPFADGLIEAIEAGATAVIQPGGSIRDEEVINAANERGIAMVFTGIRHFKH